MKGLIIATHGKLSTGLKDSVNVITGMGEQVETLQLNQNDNLDDFETDFLEVVSKYHTQGSIVLVDMIGGSPYNVAMKHLKDYNYHVVSGVNLAMVIELLTNLESMTLEELTLLANEIGEQSIRGFTASGTIEATKSEVDEIADSENSEYATGGEITFARVDHRLLHGQVVTKWSRLADVQTVIIVDDILYEDEYMAEVYRSAAPVGIEVIVAPNKVIGYAYQNNTLPAGRVMLLFKDIENVEKAYKEGLHLENLQLGGVPNDGSKKMVFTAVSLSERDIEILNEVEKDGTNIELQVVPEESGISYKEALKRFNKN